MKAEYLLMAMWFFIGVFLGITIEGGTRLFFNGKKKEGNKEK